MLIKETVLYAAIKEAQEWGYSPESLIAEGYFALNGWHAPNGCAVSIGQEFTTFDFLESNHYICDRCYHEREGFQFQGMGRGDFHDLLARVTYLLADVAVAMDFASSTPSLSHAQSLIDNVFLNHSEMLSPEDSSDLPSGLGDYCQLYRDAYSNFVKEFKELWGADDCLPLRKSAADILLPGSFLKTLPAYLDTAALKAEWESVKEQLIGQKQVVLCVYDDFKARWDTTALRFVCGGFYGKGFGDEPVLMQLPFVVAEALLKNSANESTESRMHQLEEALTDAEMEILISLYQESRARTDLSGLVAMAKAL